MAQKEIPKKVLEEDDIDPSLNTDFDFFDDLKYATAYRLQFHQLSHPQFSTLGLLFENRDPRQDLPEADIRNGYRQLSLHTLYFLNAYLKNDEQSQVLLSEKENATLSIQLKKAAKKPFRFQNFNDLAAQQEYQNLKQLWEKLQLQNKDMMFPEYPFNNLGLQLAFHPNRGQAGINVLELATQIYPRSANLYDSLAEAYLFLDNKEAAKRNFKKSLELDPQNTNAQKRLKELGE